MPIELDEIKSYTVPVSNINDVKLNPNIIFLKNETGKIGKPSRPCAIHLISKCPN